MQLIDWIFALLPILLVLGIGLYARRHMKSVADFTTSGRLAGPYLLAVSRGELEAGAVVFVAYFEVVRHSGFNLTWWLSIATPVGILVAISGFVVYRYRESRAMTLAQFFELRYSKRFRLFTGILGFIAGMANFGIIPGVGARFMVYFLGLPPEVSIFAITIPTYIPLMGLLISITLFLALSGGLITVLVTNCLEGILVQLFYLAIIASLIYLFKWEQISTVLSNAPPGKSLLNPFDSLGLSDFNLWYILMSLFVCIYGTMAWQNSSAYNAAAISPHASVMGKLLGNWREMGKATVITLLAICAITYLEHPDFQVQSEIVHQTVAQISNPQLAKQMELPIAVSHLLPVGIKGIFCAVLLMGVFGGDSTHLHSWGTIFVQDVLVPLRRKPFKPERHILVLRISIVCVAVFAFLFGACFQQTEYIVMWWAVTTAIYVGGAGAVIIGGLYWKKGTTAGAWAALVAGSGLSVGGIIARQIFGDSFPINGIQVSFFTTLIAIALYVGVSLLTSKGDFNMDRLLHRGEYAVLKKIIDPQAIADSNKEGKVSWGKIIGFDENFTVGDKWIAGSLFWWGILWFLVFAIGSIWNLIAPWPTSVWATYWHVAGIGVPIFITAVTSIWFTWGGARDIRRLFRSLAEQKVNSLDDGTVVGHQNLDEAVVSEDLKNR